MAVSFNHFYERALDRFGSKDALMAEMPTLRPIEQLDVLSDDRYLSAMSLRVFRAGLKHSEVNGRWPKFEVAFSGFSPSILAATSDEDLEARMQQEGVIKHWGKVKSVRHNAAFVQACSNEYGSFGRWIALWPVEDITSLWQELSKSGEMLGGMSGQSFLRYIGKDTPLLTDDVVTALKNMGLIEGNPMNKSNLAIIQRQFNEWHQQSNLAYSHISKILAMTIDEPETIIN